MHFIKWFSLYLISSTAYFNYEVDVSWDFNDNEITSGWGNSTSEEIDIILTVNNGILKGDITGTTPILESPSLFLNITRQHYVVVRMAYTGIATQGRLLLRNGPALSPDKQLLVTQSYWSGRLPMIVIEDSGSSSPVTSSQQAIDGNLLTYYLSSTLSNAFIIFDLQTFRWITSIRIVTIGDNRSPRKCALQQSITSGVGPFLTVTSFTLSPNATTSTNPSVYEQSFGGFSAYARYWRIIFIDNYGGNGIGVREINLDGYDETVTVVPFDLNNKGLFETYYLPISSYLNGMLLRMRFELVYTPLPSTTYNPVGLFLEQVLVDYIRIVRAPEIHRVYGCLDKYYEDNNFVNPSYNVTTIVQFINNNLPLQSFIKNSMTLPYSTTYNCPLSGGTIITIEGINFGDFPIATVGGVNCPIISNQYASNNPRYQIIQCQLPAYSSMPTVNGVQNSIQTVGIANGILPSLFYETPSLTYQLAPSVPDVPIVTNIAAYKVDLVWTPPGDELYQMTVTGYQIIWLQPKFPSRASNLTVGNVTTTSIRGLTPGTEYVFAIAAISEAQGDQYPNFALAPTDLYGRRELSPTAMIGTFSEFTNITGTLLFDFEFSFFNSNKTLNSSGATSSVSLGPTGQFGSDGHYGLVLVGSANIQNCNVSSTCCDGYNATIGISSCGNYASVCAVLPSDSLAYEYVIDGITRRGVPTNLPYSNGSPPGIAIITLDALIANKGAGLPTIACGPALRLTDSAARESGSSWYRRKMDVREGFDTTLTFQLSNPSQKCDRLDDVNTLCRSRGADGFAFVIQNVAPDALGNAGSGLGYEGIFNALAIELDTYHNYDQMDFYENHISVMTQGFRYNISANHSRSLATSNKIPDLTDGVHQVRIRYSPNFDETDVLHPSFQVNGYTTWFINNADFQNGGEGDWGVGFGLLYVYVDDLYSPVITTPLNLDATLNLDNGRAYVGFTAATGTEYWQAHDVLYWKFSSLYIDQDYTAPTLVNNQGDQHCVNETVCVHPVDYVHYMRKNNVWGSGDDSTEGWQTGKEGLCSTC